MCYQVRLVGVGVRLKCTMMKYHIYLTGNHQILYLLWFFNMLKLYLVFCSKHTGPSLEINKDCEMHKINLLVLRMLYIECSLRKWYIPVTQEFHFITEILSLKKLQSSSIWFKMCFHDEQKTSEIWLWYNVRKRTVFFHWFMLDRIHSTYAIWKELKQERNTTSPNSSKLSTSLIQSHWFTPSVSKLSTATENAYLLPGQIEQNGSTVKQEKDQLIHPEVPPKQVCEHSP